MLKILYQTIESKHPVWVSFSSGDYGRFAVQYPLQDSVRFVPINLGIALEVREIATVRDAELNGWSWYSFKACDLATMADRQGISDATLKAWIASNPDLVCRSLDEVKAFAKARLNRTMPQRPFVTIDFGELGPIRGIVWEVYEKRMGMYIGKGLERMGGLIYFGDFEKARLC